MCVRMCEKKAVMDAFFLLRRPIQLTGDVFMTSPPCWSPLPARPFAYPGSLCVQLTFHASPPPFPLRPICAGGVGSATCLNGALLLISRTDRILYIEHGAGLNDVLTDKRIHNVSHRFLMERGSFVFVTIYERRL